MNQEAALLYAATLGLKSVKEMVGFSDEDDGTRRRERNEGEMCGFSIESINIRRIEGDEVVDIGKEIEMVVIMLSCMYVAESMNDAIWSWERDGYRIKVHNATSSL